MNLSVFRGRSVLSCGWFSFVCLRWPGKCANIHPSPRFEASYCEENTCTCHSKKCIRSKAREKKDYWYMIQHRVT